jgi:hypothetical protein
MLLLDYKSHRIFNNQVSFLIIFCRDPGLFEENGRNPLRGKDLARSARLGGVGSAKRNYVVASTYVGFWLHFLWKW